MRVLHVMASGAQGGGADHLHHLLPALAELGIDSQAAVGQQGPLTAQLEARGIRVHALELMHSRLDVRAIWALWRLLRRVAPDLVHYHGTRAATYGAWACAGARHRVYTVHGVAYRQPNFGWRRQVFVAAEALACRSAHLTLSVSAGDLRDLRARRCLPATAGLHVPNAVDAQHFQPAAQAPARRLLGLPKAGLWVGTVARLVPQKAVHDLLQASLGAPQLRIAVVGEGPERAALAAHPAVRSGQARLLGARSDIAALLPAFDIFALPSHWEGEPIALLEAMACGLPCVATRTDGAAALLEASGGGLLVDIAAPAQLGTALAALAADAPRRRALGAAARAYAGMRTHARQAQAVLSAYRQVVASPAPPG